jgi:hypothetical protein
LSVITAGLFIGVPAALAVAPNPLENAYWRFEGGTAGSDVPTGDNTVEDSSNDNDMKTFADFTAPTYTFTVPPTPLRSGLPNNLALDFSPNQDLFTADKKIDNPTIANGFTLEAAFMANTIDRYQVIVGKDGRPNPPMNEQTLSLKMRGDTNELQIELFDDSNTIHGVRSTGPLVANQWYYAAVVNDGTNLSLYLDRNDGAGYVLQGTDPSPLMGALWSGDAADSSTDTSWTIGRGMFGGGVTDWFDGLIDEVRLTNSVLSPSQFLFAPIPEPSTAILALLAFAGLSWHGRAQRRR